MAHETLINRLGQQFGERLPSSLQTARSELEGLLRDALSRMDLLTRDEFDVQQTLLARTRSKVDALESQLRDLEAQLTALEKK